MAGRPKKRARLAAAATEGANLPAVIPAPPEPTNRFGRPTKFRAWMIDEIRELCIAGATNAEIARHLEINKTTLNEWRHAHPEVAAVMKLGKDLADDRLERKAFEIANGYTVMVKKQVKLRDQYGNERIELADEEVFVPPNPDMVRWMLKNRRGKDWQDKTEQKIVGEVAHIHLTVEQMRERVAARLEALEAPKGDGE